MDCKNVSVPHKILFCTGNLDVFCLILQIVVKLWQKCTEKTDIACTNTHINSYNVARSFFMV